MRSQLGKLRGAVWHPHLRLHRHLCPCLLLHQCLHPCQHQPPYCLEAALVSGSRRQISMHSSQTLTMLLAQGPISLHMPLWLRQHPLSPTLQTLVTFCKTNSNLRHSWARRAMRPLVVGPQRQVVHRPGATVSKKRWAVKQALAHNTAQVAIPVQGKGSTVLVLQGKHTKVVGRCSSVGTITMVLSAITSTTMQLCSSMIQVVSHQTRSWLTKLRFGSG